MLKNSSFRDLLPHFGFITGLATVVISWAVLKYQKTN
jgi:ABC-2 type transport system permease protein